MNGVRDFSEQVGQVRHRMDNLATAGEKLITITVSSGVETSDTPFVNYVIGAAAEISRQFTYDPARHRALQRHITVTIPTPSGPVPNLAATQRMAGAAVAPKGGPRAERAALDSKPTAAIST